MPDKNELIKKADIEKIAQKGQEIYDKIKNKYLPQDKGKFLAIDIESGEAFLGITSAEALELASQKYPEKVFYVVKIGFDVTEIMANMANWEL